jgi:hypothetical protein
MICEKCKANIPDTAKFCPKCGAKVEVVEDKKTRWDYLGEKPEVEKELKEKFDRLDTAKKDEDIIAGILNLCESDPDTGLKVIESSVIKNPELDSNPITKFARALAYGSKGLFQLSRSKPEINFTPFNKKELRNILGITDTHLDFLEKGLQEIKKMEDIHPGALKLFGTEDDRIGELKVDGMAMVLERCRPSKVQQILGQTKIQPESCVIA